MGVEPTVAAPDLVVLSDLHLGEGRPRDDELYCVQEDFFSDEVFARFMEHLRDRYRDRQRELVVVLNGDVFDFLTVTTYPDPAAESPPGFPVTPQEEKFGLEATPAKSVFKLEAIFAGHSVFFRALSSMVAAGHRLEILRGNHDLELYFPEVQVRLKELIASQGGATADQVERLVHFHNWFYLEPGRVYIEHGNQYEESNSIRYPFRPLLPGLPDEQQVLDYPLGSMFVRYFYNQVRRSNPYAPRVASFEQYMGFLVHYNLLDLIQVGREQYPFFVSALDPRVPSGTSRSSNLDDARHEATLRSLAPDTEPPDLYREISDLKVHPLSASKVGLVREMLRPLIRRFVWIAGLSLAVVYIWLFFFNLFQDPRIPGGPFVRAILLLVLTVASSVAAVWGANVLRRIIGRRRDLTVDKCRDRGIRIGHAAAVPLVLMGHTHVVDYHQSPGRRVTYANSGTWIATESPWDRLVSNPRKNTFLLVSGKSVRLRRWNDNALRMDEVPVFDHTTRPDKRWFAR